MNVRVLTWLILEPLLCRRVEYQPEHLSEHCCLSSFLPGETGTLRPRRGISGLALPQWGARSPDRHTDLGTPVQAALFITIGKL